MVLKVIFIMSSHYKWFLDLIDLRETSLKTRIFDLYHIFYYLSLLFTLQIITDYTVMNNF